MWLTSAAELDLRAPSGEPGRRPPLERLIFRRQFYLQLPRIVADRLRHRDPGDRAFVCLMGGIGDLVNFFPTLDHLASRYTIDMATGAGAARALVERHPSVARLYVPFVYKPHRAAHRRLITRVLSPFYARVLLADSGDGRWWARGQHLSALTAEACGCPPPTRARIYLSDADRARAAAWLERRGVGKFIYVAQVIRRRRAFRSWPLAHHHALYEKLRARFDCPILVDTAGSDETAVPDFCDAVDGLDLMTAAALIERASLFIGPDSGLTHVAAALERPTVAIHLGFPPESSRALGDTVAVVRQPVAFADPALTSVDEVWAAVLSLTR